MAHHFDSETLTQQVGRKKKKTARHALAAEVESVQGFFVLTRDEAAGRSGNGRVVTTINFDVGDAHESGPLVVSAERRVPRKAVETQQLAARICGDLFGKLEQLESQAARVATDCD